MGPLERPSSFSPFDGIPSSVQPAKDSTISGGSTGHQEVEQSHRDDQRVKRGGRGEGRGRSSRSARGDGRGRGRRTNSDKSYSETLENAEAGKSPAVEQDESGNRDGRGFHGGRNSFTGGKGNKEKDLNDGNDHEGGRSGRGRGRGKDSSGRNGGRADSRGTGGSSRIIDNDD